MQEKSIYERTGNKKDRFHVETIEDFNKRKDMLMNFFFGVGFLFLVLFILLKFVFV